MNAAPLIVGAVLARDEADHLTPCLASLGWTDARVVMIDDRTTDLSAEVARNLGATVVSRPFISFPTQRNAMLDVIESVHPKAWVFFVDPDERVNPALAAEIRRVVASSDIASPVGYWVPRRNYTWGAWIRHGGWSPDYQMRLLRNDRVRYDEIRDVHELAVLQGPAGFLRESLVHYNYDGIQQFLTKQRHYARLEARRLHRAGIRARPQNFVLQPLREFRRRFLELEGYRDGWRGLVLSLLLAWYAGVMYLDLAKAK